MNLIPITQAEPISETQSRNLPLATAVEHRTSAITLDLRENTSVPGQILDVCLDWRNICGDPEIMKLELLSYWTNTLENETKMTSDEVDNIIQLLFHQDLLWYKELYKSAPLVPKDTLAVFMGYDQDYDWSDGYLIGKGEKCRWVAIMPKLYKDYSKDWVDEYYNALLINVYASAWKKHNTQIIVEMGFTKNNDEEESLCPYAILIDKDMLSPILFAIKNDIKVVVTDKLNASDMDKIEEHGKWGWSTKKPEYKPSPTFAQNNITFNKTEEYSSISTFVEPYVKFQLNWEALKENATVLI